MIEGENRKNRIARTRLPFKRFIRLLAMIGKGLVDLRLEAEVASGKSKKELKAKIKESEEALNSIKTH